MQNHSFKRQFLLALLAGVILAASGCAGANPSASQNIDPTVVVVQYVTQVVATVTPAPPMPTQPPATAEPVVPASSTGFDPFRVEVYYPIMGCKVASRIHSGERAYVANNRSGTLGFHMSADIGDAPIYRSMNNGEILEVVNGPYCQLDSLVWGVLDNEGKLGYVAEGDGNSYWLLPLGEKVDKEVMKDVQKAARLQRMGMPADCPPR
jgi:hypothetical protein